VLELAAELLRRVDGRSAFVAATVTSVDGSAPRRPGASLIVDAGGAVLGNVSGGCVDSAVHQACEEMLLGDDRPRVVRFGYSDEDAFGVGLTCGGTIELILRRHDPGTEPELGQALAAAAHNEPVAVATIVRGPGERLGRAIVVRPGRPPAGTLGDDQLDQAAVLHTIGMLHAGRTGTVELGGAGGSSGEPMTLLVESSTPAPRMLIFGAIDHAAALARIGSFLGYHVTVCDARATFATPERFPDADEVVVDWPHRYLQSQPVDAGTVICVLTHDPKFDVPVLEAALRLPVAYIGAMGSRRTCEDRLMRLREAGLTEPELSRLHSPIGLDLGAHTPQEIALSIAAEIVAHRYGGAGVPLRTASAIHHGDPYPVDRTPSFRPGLELGHGAGIAHTIRTGESAHRRESAASFGSQESR
jgi:xanthine dehydrogenase accessory factor